VQVTSPTEITTEEGITKVQYVIEQQQYEGEHVNSHLHEATTPFKDVPTIMKTHSSIATNKSLSFPINKKAGKS